MVSRKQKQDMKDFLVAGLEGFGLNIEPCTKPIVEKKDSSYVLVGSKGIVLLIDRPYAKDAFLKLHSQARQSKRDVAVVLFKDGKSYFRSAKHRGHQRRKKGRSLERYSVGDLQKLLMLHPIESFLAENRSYVQYYQPDSPRLNEGIECFQFKPIVFDYTHIPETKRFGPEKEKSKSLFLWKYRGHLEGSLVLDGDYLKDVRAVEH